MLLRIVVAVYLAGVALGCGDNKAPLRTIADYIRADSRFSTMEKALTDADLLATLEEPGPFTLFAFENGQFEVEILDPAQLQRLLEYHIHEGELTTAALERRTATTTVEGSEIHVRFGLDGLLLNDGVKVASDPIVTENGIIHVLDRALSRTLFTQTVTLESAPELLIDGFASDYLYSEDERYIHDLRVFLDIEQANVSNLFVNLRHAETGAFLWLVRQPSTTLDNLELTLADGAALDVVSDLARDGEPGDEAFPAAVYRPLDPLEYMVGEPLAGEWDLTVFNFGRDPEEEGESHLLRWGMVATVGAEMPAPAVVFNPRRAGPKAFAQGFREVSVVEARRVGGLAGEMELSGDLGDVLAASNTLEPDEDFGALEFTIPESAEPGPRTVSLAARVGEVSRILSFDADLVSPRSDGINLLSHVPLPHLGALGGAGNDIWGWTDPVTNKEIALVGTTTGTAFVDLSQPKDPVVLGTLPTETDPSTWRDIKVYRDHAFVVSEATDHGMQIFDLTQLRDTPPGAVFAPTAYNSDFGSAHNIAINEEAATAYVVGSDFEGCSGGMLVFDISAPLSPLAIACFSGAVTNGQAGGPAYPTDVYTHDVQCVTYAGPDQDYQGREICFSSDEQSIGVADLTDASAPLQIVRMTYDSVGYSHQGWLTEDHRYFISNDEFDEVDLELQTRSYVWDMRDLDSPELIGLVENPTSAIGHNTYIHGDIAYQANYASGIRLIDTSDIANGASPEVAYYDTHPDDDATCRSESDCGVASFDGAWSSYPFFASGVIVVSDTRRGLFVLERE